MEADARIRLEGRLERVEQATLEAQGALDALKHNAWQPAANVLAADLRESVAAVRAMAAEEPSLERVLARFERAHRRLERAVAMKAAQRGVDEAPPREQLRTLLADQVLYEAKLRNPMPSFAVPIYGALVLIVLMEHHQPLALVFPAMVGAFVSLLVVSYGAATSVLVTEDRLVVGSQVVKLGDVLRVTTDVRNSGAPRPYTLTIELKRWIRTLKLPWIPQELVQALVSRGVAIERREWPYESNRLSRL